MSHRRKVTSPSFPFYAKDYLAGTCGLSFAAQGLYWRLCSISWDWGGPLPLDHAALIRAAGATPQEWAELWPEIEAKFRKLKGGYINRRLERIRAEVREFRASRTRASHLAVEARRRKKTPPQEPPSDIAASQADYAANPPAVAPVFAQSKNPHANPKALVNGHSQRRHAANHAWCNERGLCVTQWVHEELLGKLGGPERDTELRAWYTNTILALNGQPLGDEPDKFWRNKFAEWIPVATTSADTHSKSARTMAALRRTAHNLDGPSMVDVFTKAAKPS